MAPNQSSIGTVTCTASISEEAAVSLLNSLNSSSSSNSRASSTTRGIEVHRQGCDAGKQIKTGIKAYFDVTVPVCGVQVLLIYCYTLYCAVMAALLCCQLYLQQACVAGCAQRGKSVPTQYLALLHGTEGSGATHSLAITSCYCPLQQQGYRCVGVA